MKYYHFQVKYSCFKAGVTSLILLLVSTVCYGNEPTWDESAVRHLLSRSSFGSDSESILKFSSITMEKAVDLLLEEAERAPELPEPKWVRDVWVNTLRRYSDMPREEYLVTFRRTSHRNDEELLDLKSSVLSHTIASTAPLRENMTFFWHGYFTSASSKMFAVSQAFYLQDKTWRKHALGNFRAFIEAVTLDPGMLIYLDMEESEKSNPNENYARELLELFTLGVGNYTENDVREIARAFTGWILDAPQGTIKINRPTNPETARSLRRDGLIPTFIKEKHDFGQKTVLGKTGFFGVKDILDIVVAHQACGPHIAARMIEYFGAYDPNGNLKARMAKAFVESKYEIKPMLKVLFTSPEFYSKKVIGNRVKSPYRLLVGACRDLKLTGTVNHNMVQSMVFYGQELFNPPTVKGWPSGTDWITSTTLSLRYRLGEILLDNRPLNGMEPLGRIRGTLIPRDPIESKRTINRLLALDSEKASGILKSEIGLQFKPETWISSSSLEDSEKLVDEMLSKLLSIKPRISTRNAIIEACKAVPKNEQVTLAAKLILGSADYQVE